MKKLLFLLLLLPIVAAAQADKDSLLQRDREIIIAKLKFMDYLRPYGLRGQCMGYMQRLKSDRVFEQFYNDTLIAKNPVPSMNIASHLKARPKNWKELSDAIANANYEMAFDILKTYGYLSTKRLGEPRGGTLIEQFANMSYEDRRPIGKILKGEYKLGRMTDREYELFGFLMSKNATDERSINKMAEKGFFKVSSKDVTKTNDK